MVLSALQVRYECFASALRVPCECLASALRVLWRVLDRPAVRLVGQVALSFAQLGGSEKLKVLCSRMEFRPLRNSARPLRCLFTFRSNWNYRPLHERCRRAAFCATQLERVIDIVDLVDLAKRAATRAGRLKND